MDEFEVVEMGEDHIDLRHAEGHRYGFGVVIHADGERRLSDTVKVRTNDSADEAPEALFASAYSLARHLMREACHIDR